MLDLRTLSSHVRARSEVPSQGFGLSNRQWVFILDSFGPSLKQVDRIFMGWIFCIILCRVVH